jgi:hypothetical protein
VAQDSWPSPAHNARAVSDTEYEKIAARFSDDGVWGTPSDAAVVSAGIGRSVDVRAGVYASVRGHAWSSGTSAVNLAVTANSSGQNRVDRVVLRLDRSDWTVRAVVKTGTPGSGAPALSQSTGDTGTYEIPLAEVTIVSGASTVTVTRKELYVGSRIRPALASSRNPTPFPGEMVFETDTKRVRVWTGSAWLGIFEDSGIITADAKLSGWDITASTVLQKRNGNVHLRMGSFQRNGSLASTAESRLPVLIPAAYRHATRDQIGLAYITGVQIGRFIVYSAASDRAGQVWLTQHPTMATDDYVLPQSGLSWVVD